MGEVYRARDTKLNREVALKVLPDLFADDPDRLARFQREAEVLASLNHPNIAQIYGLEEQDGVRALVLELVEGPTLAELIERPKPEARSLRPDAAPERGLPLDDVLSIAGQIAEALETAHKHGIIHRDLKPANVKVRGDGTVKVLDFGLAKALGPEPADASGDPGLSPTLTAAATQMGVILGTAAYMAPEQAKGKPVDRRADIWAFGAVLYEMLTGRRPFAGEDISDTLAFVLTKDIDWTALPSDTPPSLRRLLKRGLERDPRQRLRDIGEARIQLARPLEEDSPSTSDVSAPAGQTRGRLTTLAAAVVLTALATGAVVWTFRGSDAPPSRDVRRFVIPLTDHQFPSTGPGPFVALSQDGRTLVYTGVRDGTLQLYRRPHDQLESFPIQGTENARRPFLSPDGQSVGFVTGGTNTTLQSVPLAGGTPSTIVEMPEAINGAAWGRDGRIVLGMSTGLFTVPAAGGVATPLTTEASSDDGLLGYRWPQLLPGGETLLYVRWRGSIRTSEVTARSMVTGEERVLVNGSGAHYAASGHLVYALDTELWATPFSPERLELTGAPARVAEGLLTFTRGGAASFTLASDGSMVYVPTSVDVSDGSQLLRWVTREGDSQELISPGFLQSPRYLQLSPDGRRLALVMGPFDQGSLWVYELDGRPPVPLVQNERVAFPVWSTDGTLLTYRAGRDDSPGDLVRVAADGSIREPELLLVGPDEFTPFGWTSDDEHLLFGREADDGSGNSLWRLDSNNQPQLLLNEGTNQSFSAQLSPDGGWIAYESSTTGATEVWVRPYPEGAPIRISNRGGEQPRWSADRRELFYLATASFNGGQMMAVSVETDPEFQFDPPEMLFDGAYDHRDPFSYVPHGDGRFIMLSNASNAIVAAPTRSTNPLGDHMVAIVNLNDELRRIAPAER